jgi:hypothetical protein
LDLPAGGSPEPQHRKPQSGRSFPDSYEVIVNVRNIDGDWQALDLQCSNYLHGLNAQRIGLGEKMASACTSTASLSVVAADNFFGNNRFYYP